MSVVCWALIILAQTSPVTSPAGAYTVTTPGPTTITYAATSVTFSWGMAPTPTPLPPAPPPPPVPILTGHVWILIIHDPAVTLASAQQAALTSSTLKSEALRHDIDLRTYKHTDPAVAGWLPHCDGTALPALLCVQKSPSGQGELAYSTALPGSETEILALCSKLRGK